MINFYGILISLSILCSVLVVEYLLKKNGRYDSALVWEGALWAIVFGVVGARLYHVLSLFPYYLENPLNIVKIWNGGLGILGAVVGGFIGLIIFLRKKKIPWFPFLDMCAVSLPLAQAIGRWGNYFNQEVLGTETKLFWGFKLNDRQYHPIFLYESVLNLTLFIILFGLYKSKFKYKNGSFLAFYFIGYGFIRFFLEFIRTDSWILLGLNVPQTLSILLVLISFAFLKYDIHLFRSRGV